MLVAVLMGNLELEELKSRAESCFLTESLKPGRLSQVVSREDLELVARLVEKHNAYAILDEVYEHLVFQGSEHITLRSLPNMQERAIRIGSAGKTFSFTGWKVQIHLQTPKRHFLGGSLLSFSSVRDIFFLYQSGRSEPFPVFFSHGVFPAFFLSWSFFGFLEREGPSLFFGKKVPILKLFHASYVNMLVRFNLSYY
jgi:hypothetical protein